MITDLKFGKKGCQRNPAKNRLAMASAQALMLLMRVSMEGGREEAIQGPTRKRLEMGLLV